LKEYENLSIEELKNERCNQFLCSKSIMKQKKIFDSIYRLYN